MATKQDQPAEREQGKSYGACVLNCGSGNVRRGRCAVCGTTGLCEKCRALPCPHRKPEKKTEENTKGKK